MKPNWNFRAPRTELGHHQFIGPHHLLDVHRHVPANLAIAVEALGLAEEPKPPSDPHIEIPILATLRALHEVRLVVETDLPKAIRLDQAGARASREISKHQLKPDNAFESLSVHAGRKPGTGFVDRDPRGIHQADIARCVEQAAQLLGDPLRVPDVVGIQRGDEIAARGSNPEISCRGDPFVRLLQDPDPRVVTREATQDLGGSVRGAIVDDKDLQASI
ncbi:hypothetical protein LT988_03565 [Thiocapsa bogorovii]|nr:hypothetical protein [Thiocapsa bogorovii]UHD17147.1 hypothetical protein LT988_03565 [Thiocapsa bogorovii]